MDKTIESYEEVLVLHPDSTPEEQKELYRSSAKIIESFQGTVHNVDTWGSRPLANKGGKKFSRGWYFHMTFSAAPQAMAELRRKLRINNRVIYFHHEKLIKKTTHETHRQQFFEILENSARREKERQIKMQKKSWS